MLSEAEIKEYKQRASRHNNIAGMWWLVAADITQPLDIQEIAERTAREHCEKSGEILHQLYLLQNGN